MKKLLSIVLAVAMMASMSFAAFAAPGASSMLPPSADKFEYSEPKSSGDGTATVEATGDGYTVMSDKGWPCVWYNMDADGFRCNKDDDLYLNFDFEVVSGATQIVVFYAGQNPKDMAGAGTCLSLNVWIDPANETSTGVLDLPVGKYSGSVPLSELGYGEAFLGDNGEMLLSGCKIFAVGEGGKVVVNKLEYGPKDGDSNGGSDTDTTTTKKQSGTDTTTTKKQSSSSDDNPKTGVESDAIALAVVALAAAGVVTLSVVSKKAKSR